MFSLPLIVLLKEVFPSRIFKSTKRLKCPLSSPIMWAATTIQKRMKTIKVMTMSKFVMKKKSVFDEFDHPEGNEVKYHSDVDVCLTDYEGQEFKRSIELGWL